MSTEALVLSIIFGFFFFVILYQVILVAINNSKIYEQLQEINQKLAALQAPAKEE